MTEFEKNNPLIALSVLYDKNICNNIKRIYILATFQKTVSNS